MATFIYLLVFTYTYYKLNHIKILDEVIFTLT